MQESLPTLELDTIAELSEKAEAYQKTKNERLSALARELILKTELINLMKAHNKTVYRDGELIVEITQGKDNLKVKYENGEDSE